MKYAILLSFCFLLLTCKQKETPSETITSATTHTSKTEASSGLTIVFASCSDQEREQPLWKPILENNPDLFIWGGDNIYADTDDMAKMEADYKKTKAHPDYQKLLSATPVVGTWDDHDFGKNDAGKEWIKKDEAQTLLLNFLDVPENDERRSRPGVYTSKTIEGGGGAVKVILLDTRYFRDPLKESNTEGRRYDDWSIEESGTILGAAQWQWLEEELQDSVPTFTMIVSSIQFLSKEHGWEKWGNHPSEVQKMYDVLETAKARNIFMVSGDRHMAEISVNIDVPLPYPLVDFTSSGLTHTWPTYGTEGNEYRVSNIIKRLNFGVMHFDFEKKRITFEIRGRDNFLYEQFQQQY